MQFKQKQVEQQRDVSLEPDDTPQTNYANIPLSKQPTMIIGKNSIASEHTSRSMSSTHKKQQLMDEIGAM